jgi:hypothetical protein
MGTYRPIHPGMDSRTERLVAWLLRSVAGAMTFAGTSALVAAVPLFLFADMAGALRTIGWIVLQIATVFVTGGIAARYLLGTAVPILPGERAAVTDSDDAGHGWVTALAVSLVGLPVVLVFLLRPFLAEWNTVLRLLAESDMWENANANMSGVILLPLFAALTPPFIELMTAVGFVATSALLLILLRPRSGRFPRTYLVCAVMLTALVIASVRSVDAARLAADGVQQLAADSNARPGETDELRAGISRYMTAVTSAAPPLIWTLFAYMAWMVPLFSVRHSQVFARRRPTPEMHAQVAGHGIAATSAAAPDVESITSPPRFPKW